MKCDNELYIYIFALYFAKYHSGFIYNSLKKDYEDILKFYYKGIDIVDYNNIKSLTPDIWVEN